VRNNQRRSRARKREYVAELERKLKECEVNGPPLKEIVSKDIARRLEEENRKLRELLARVGLDQTLVNAHLSKSQSQEKYDSTLDAPNVVLGTATIKKDCRCGPSKFSNSAGEKENPQRDKDRLQLPNREQVTARAVGLESNGIVVSLNYTR
jgi:ribosomal protein L18E